MVPKMTKTCDRKTSGFLKSRLNLIPAFIIGNDKVVTTVRIYWVCSKDGLS